MTGQLALLKPEPEPLTPRQQEALEHLRRAGPDGLTAHELGEALYGSRPEARAWGNSAAQALRRKGLVVQRGRHRVWVALTEPEVDDRSSPTSTTDATGAGSRLAPVSGSASAVPPDGLPVYGSFPENY